jgi:hypothetical protein
MKVNVGTPVKGCNAHKIASNYFPTIFWAFLDSVLEGEIEKYIRSTV